MTQATQLVNSDAVLVTYKNNDAIAYFLDNFMKMNVQDWMLSALPFLEGYPSVNSVVVEVSYSQLVEWEQRAGAAAAQARILNTKWSGFHKYGVRVSTVMYDRRLDVDGRRIQYLDGTGLYSYFIINYNKDQEIYNAMEGATYELIDCFKDMLLQAIKDIGNEKRMEASLHFPFIAAEAFTGALKEAVLYHNERVCFVSPLTKKVKYTLEHQEGGFKVGSALTARVNLYPL